jgi:hypothetical protein
MNESRVPRDSLKFRDKLSWVTAHQRINENIVNCINHYNLLHWREKVRVRGEIHPAPPFKNVVAQFIGLPTLSLRGWSRAKRGN